MATQQIVINVPDKVLLAEKTDAKAFAGELSMLAAVKLFELGRLSSGRAAEFGGTLSCRVFNVPWPLQSIPLGQ